MKKVFSSHSVVECELVKSALESAGIPSMIRNEQGSAVGGEGIPVPDIPSLPYSWSELWVNLDDYEEAAAIVSRQGAPAEDAPAEAEKPAT